MTAPDPVASTPLTARPEVLDFLATRRSRPAKTLTAPAPDRAALTPLLAMALRVPDHGKLEPWRLIVLERGALDRLARLAGQRAEAAGLAPDQAAKGIAQFADSPLCVAVVSVPRDTAKVPEWEQVLSAGAAAAALCNAAQAAGWGACWLTGWPAYERGFLAEGLALAEGERIAGFVHIGTETSLPPDRPRPDPETAIDWRAA
ncbi:nitroreductase family protein [Frigidibacter sp. MR17.24]|uniref:nitroreductase family protein n=1 Tax=Frigidibacter sp. MR17.24 TaxID=3127345 RepID=UPI003012F18A